MFGKILNLATTPVRAVAAPVKLTIDLINDERPEHAVTDTIRYIITAKEKVETMNGFLDFDDD